MQTFGPAVLIIIECSALESRNKRIDHMLNMATEQYSFYESPYGERRPLFAASSQPGLAYHHHLQPPYYHSMVTTQPAPGPSTANGPVFPPGVEPHRNPFAVQRPPEPPREDSEEDGINCSPCCDNENEKSGCFPKQEVAAA
ncbi:hypothetical protein ANCDUO_06500 [Ancylostoma duodenale]|uniref:Uncharacterized protein n=1 Tax=Ancylostoma duodenale TaxID=51022 RepID=A0A0C2GVX1_9BILA|nr:hypothetical protein ANCDUO_06500 [Ancylostoma duodenale]